MVTRRRVNPLKETSERVRGKIESLFTRACTKVDGNFVWGQWLGEQGSVPQYGIYGTSAAIQVLVTGHSTDQAVIRSACQRLDQMSTEPSDPFEIKGDLDVSFKLAAIVQAQFVAQWKSSVLNQVIEKLLTHKISEKGWGCGQGDTESRLSATSVCLVALKDHVPLRSMTECKEALEWLARRLLQNGSLQPFETALALIALKEYQNTGFELPDAVDQAIQKGSDRLAIAICGDAIRCGVKRNYSYSVTGKHMRNNRYLFFLEDCIASIALIKVGMPKKCRRAVLTIIDFYCGEIEDRGGFSDGSGISTVDHFWIDRLLQEFAESPLLPYTWTCEISRASPRYSPIQPRYLDGTIPHSLVDLECRGLPSSPTMFRARSLNTKPSNDRLCSWHSV